MADPKATLYQHFARVGKALGHPKRLEMLHLLGQGERSVESLAAACGLNVTTASAQLQVLRQSRLVDTRRDGVKVFYRLANDSVYHLLLELEQVARSRLAEVEQIARDYFDARDSLQTVGRAELAAMLQRGEVTVLDVRPPEEYRAGHIAHAISIPTDQLSSRLRELPAGTEVVAYCRGPYCVLAGEAVAVLEAAGLRARRLEDGFPEWRLAGLPVEVGA